MPIDLMAFAEGGAPTTPGRKSSGSGKNLFANKELMAKRTSCQESSDPMRAGLLHTLWPPRGTFRLHSSQCEAFFWPAGMSRRPRPRCLWTNCHVRSGSLHPSRTPKRTAAASRGIHPCEATPGISVPLRASPRPQSRRRQSILRHVQAMDPWTKRTCQGHHLSYPTTRSCGATASPAYRHSRTTRRSRPTPFRHPSRLSTGRHRKR